MQNINMNALGEWLPLGASVELAFEVPVAGYRNVEFDLMSDRDVRVIATGESGSEWPVSVGAGMRIIRFTILEKTKVKFEGEKGARVVVRVKDQDQIVLPSDEPSYTTIEPRGPRVSDDILRMRMVMEHNQRRREAQMAAQFALMQSEIAELREARTRDTVEVIDASDLAKPEVNTDAT